MQRRNKQPLHELSIDDLNKHFTPAFTSEGNSIADILSLSNLDPLVPYKERNFFFQHVTPHNLRKTLSLSKSNSTGVDGISVKFIKAASTVLQPVILDIYNFSLLSSEFPNVWKYSLITPIQKVKKPTSPSDYRPISILCSLSKCLERIVFQQVTNYLDQCNLHDPYQSGFRKNFSTQTALLKLTDDIRQGIDKRMVTILVLFDFTNAFGLVNHATLLHKLKNLNFSCSSLNWFYSYLKDRQQAVKDANGNTSQWITVHCGVPQGSVLGPLLFSLYVLDLPRCILNCKYLLYADDLQIYLHCHLYELNDAISKVNQDVQAITSWAADNNFVLNPRKTKSMLFGTSKLLKHVDFDVLPKIFVGDAEISYANSVKNLGVLLMRNLSW